jgi:hypothetical protein
MRDTNHGKNLHPPYEQTFAVRTMRIRLADPQSEVFSGEVQFLIPRPPCGQRFNVSFRYDKHILSYLCCLFNDVISTVQVA